MTTSQYSPEHPEPLEPGVPPPLEDEPFSESDEISSPKPDELLDIESNTEDELSSELELLSEHPESVLSVFPQILGKGKECPHSPLVNEQT